MKPEQFRELAAEITVGTGSREQVPVRAPYTGEVLGCLPAGQPSDAHLAVSKARAAQGSWAAQSLAARAKALLRFHDLLLARQDEVLDLIQLENGKARRHAFEEVLDTAVVSRYYARHGPGFLRPHRRKGALPLLTETWEYRAPLGVAGFLVPWNYPLNLAVTDAIAALMAGNTAVIKPDLQTSFTALWAVRLLREAGVPRDVVHVITGDGPVLGAALGECVDYLMFTGSTATGRLVARQAAERLIGCSLELGGKNPMLVLEDADVDRAVDGAIRGCFAGTGQTCVSTERIYVHSSVAQQFLELFVRRTKELRLGAELDYSADMGSLTSERQLARVEEHVGDAVEKGAAIRAGGRRRPELGPLFYEPTILTGVSEGMKVFGEETFGPVVAVYEFSDEAQAIAAANATPYGLNASIWTRDARRGKSVARRVHAGSVNVNESYAATWGSTDSPMGGWKDSGLHPRHGTEGILKFTEAQTVAVQRLLPIGPFRWVDAERYARWMTRLVKLLRYVRVLG